jgi:hypothetical protein
VNAVCRNMSESIEYRDANDTSMNNPFDNWYPPSSEEPPDYSANSTDVAQSNDNHLTSRFSPGSVSK